jgi:phosphatidylglycerol:prolipoprotein diacylglycerol transferase
VRPRLVAFLNETFGTQVFDWLVPVPAVMYALAMLAVLLVFVRRSRAAGLLQYHALGSAIWAMVGGLVGARLLFLLLRLDRVIDDPSVIWDLAGSTISWGAYFGGGLGFVLYFARQREVIWPYADAVASALGLGPFIARFACFLNGDDFGTLSGLPWAVTYPEGSYPYASHVTLGLIGPSASHSLSVHPVQLYLALNGLALFVLFSWLWRRRQFRPGALFFLYWVAYGMTRFGLEFFRGDLNRKFVGGFPDAQLVALVIALASIVAVTILLRSRLARA